MLERTRFYYFFPDDDEDDKMQILGEYEDNDRYEYELIGVTVHTGTADGGHYYSFIRDRLHKADNGQDKWYMSACYINFRIFL